jgi:hypothetical protein
VGISGVVMCVLAMAFWGQERNRGSAVRRSAGAEGCIESKIDQYVQMVMLLSVYRVESDGITCTREARHQAPADEVKR